MSISKLSLVIIAIGGALCGLSVMHLAFGYDSAIPPKYTDMQFMDRLLMKTNTSYTFTCPEDDTTFFSVETLAGEISTPLIMENQIAAC